MKLNHDEIFIPIKDELDKVENCLSEVADSSKISLINEMARHIIFNGGKRIRPALTVLSGKMCGYTGNELIYLGAAVELIHTASIIHDDVLDNADLRRGVASTNKRWGNHLSILTGDFCLGAASSILTRKVANEAVSEVASGVMRTIEGEVKEAIEKNNVSLSITDYLNIIKLKTADLISAGCRAASIIANSPERFCDAIEEYSLNIGLAFQITDDILDYSFDNRSGKEVGNDMREGKLTLPLIYALEDCSELERKKISNILLSNDSDNLNVSEITDIFSKYSSIRRSKNLVKDYILKAKEALSIFKSSLEKDSLMQFGDFILERDL